MKNTKLWFYSKKLDLYIVIIYRKLKNTSIMLSL
mgnify:CR=1 FL=1